MTILVHCILFVPGSSMKHITAPLGLPADQPLRPVAK
jgi:hypothetical protein